MNFSLFLYADNSNELTVSKVELIDYLAELEFISVSADSVTLIAGNRLMDFITFLGCSPSLKLGDIDSTIKVHHYNRVTGMGGESIETIRYPDCKHPVHEPVKLIKSYPETANWLCPSCEIEGKTNAINWRKSAGFSKVFIEISQIFPKEAIPSDKLLDSLNKFTNSHWRWFYSTTSH